MTRYVFNCVENRYLLCYVDISTIRYTRMDSLHYPAGYPDIPQF